MRVGLWSAQMICGRSLRRRAAAALSALAVAVLLLAVCGCGPDGPLEPYKPTGESITVTSPSGEQVVFEGEDADLYREIQYIREALESGRIKWDAEALTELADDFGLGAGLEDHSLSLGGALSLIDGMLGDSLTDPLSVLDETEAQLFGIYQIPTEARVYLLDTQSREMALALQAEIAALPEVESATLVTKEEGLEEMKSKWKDNPEIFDSLTSNPLPDTITVVLKAGTSMDAFVAECSERPGVEAVRSEGGESARNVMWQMPFDMVRTLAYVPYYYEKVYE